MNAETIARAFGRPEIEARPQASIGQRPERLV
jgi:hypothetical protein